jgi:hypothetical protein
MLIVELLHAAGESAAIASVRGFRPYIEAGALVDLDPCVSAEGRSPFAGQAKLSRNRAKSSCNRVRFDLSSAEDSC